MYGGDRVASQITGGVGDLTERGGGFYNLANAYSSPSGTLALGNGTNAGTFTGSADTTLFAAAGTAISALSDQQKTALRYDPDVLGQTSTDLVWAVNVTVPAADLLNFNVDQLGAVAPLSLPTGSTRVFMDHEGQPSRPVRRLTHLGVNATSGRPEDRTAKTTSLTIYMTCATDCDPTECLPEIATISYPLTDGFAASNAIGSVVGTNDWGLEEAGVSEGVQTGAASAAAKNKIPEIDIKVDSVAVTAITKKLKAKWTPELGQDLNAYHNLDAEVELTSILSEHIALEIDREILNDLVQGAKAGTQYWSRSPGLFVNRVTGAEIGASSAAPDFTGTVSEWYETLVETINDVSAQIHRKTLRRSYVPRNEPRGCQYS